MSCVGFFPFLVSVSTCNDWTSLDPVSDRVVVLEDLNLVERLYWVTEVSEGCFGTFDWTQENDFPFRPFVNTNTSKGDVDFIKGESPKIILFY